MPLHFDGGSQELFAENQITHDRMIENKLKRRFESEIRGLEEVGFSYFGAFETSHSLPLLPLAIALGIGGREVWEIDGLFRVKWFHPLMLSQDKMTMAYPFGIGLRYYTFFENGMAHRTSACQDEASYHFKRGSNLFIGNILSGAVSDSWSSHLKFCKDHIHEGRLPVRISSADRLLTCQETEDSFAEELLGVLFGWGPVLIAMVVISHYVTLLLA